MSSLLTWFKSSYSDGEGGDCVEVALPWRKSTYSDSGGGACVEVAPPWIKSTHSDSQGGNCVEVADCAHAVHVRDSKDPAGPQLVLAPRSWVAFLGYAGRQPVG
ncbi:DUF397 domain-containing protein [Streptomyces zingiberis]|uniref:DUF397 domain-containing protein n=1 Tax=Streptomyces zingiberis TaxID=2053010 RepID=A0ABX1BQD1_9ACTN|nr:DUF397 domain-containing protein [Streptomyces zingiberis]NJP99939.1 DUF397 domain-containing protein [Streptomyces zingiberis]